MEKIALTMQNKKDIIAIVRYTIEMNLFSESKIQKPALTDEVFSKQYGVFVTLKTNHQLRGCIGYISGNDPICDAIPQLAIQAAFHDPRFYPLSKDEYPKLNVEVSILYPVEPVTNFEDITPGRDGLIMERGYHRGLLLPQVATEHGWDRERFMNETCRKAGLESFAWENGAKVSKFEAFVFGEDELE